MDMFCRQCEQTAGGRNCSKIGVCGKSPEAAVLMDLLIYGLEGVGYYAHKARAGGLKDRDTDRFVMQAMFATLTNVNFDPERLRDMVLRCYEVKQKIADLARVTEETLPAAARWEPAPTMEGLLEQGAQVGVMHPAGLDADTRSVRELLLYGLKGMAAYADHALILGRENETVNAFFHKGLAALADESPEMPRLLDLVMELGMVNLKCMETLDAAHTGRFGNPVPTKVSFGIKKGPAIIVSGHDLYDLEQLLIQTQGKGINIYTHGEMLPAHGYPGLKKYPHFAGHFGGAWQNQQKEFDGVPAAILMTTNCLQKPRESYSDRIYTTGVVGFAGMTHIPEQDGRKDFGPVIEKALALGGFPADVPGKEILTGFGHDAVLKAAGAIVQAVKDKKIRHFFLVGGCDGAKPGRNYYTELAQKISADCVILTLACGKFRFNTLEFGEIGGVPRLIDCGQCNDAYSAIVVAGELAKAFNCGINDLPLSLVLSWYEQKAVVILITLLALGVKNIRLGPTLPAFVSPGVLNLLAEKFGIRPITTPDSDLKEILG